MSSKDQEKIIASIKLKQAKLDEKINQQTLRNLDGSVEQCKEILRDTYMNFKDLQNRAVIDIMHN